MNRYSGNRNLGEEPENHTHCRLPCRWHIHHAFPHHRSHSLQHRLFRCLFHDHSHFFRGNHRHFSPGIDDLCRDQDQMETLLDDDCQSFRHKDDDDSCFLRIQHNFTACDDLSDVAFRECTSRARRHREGNDADGELKLSTQSEPDYRDKQKCLTVLMGGGKRKLQL